MREITVDNITKAVQKSWDNAPNERLKTLLQKFVPYLHDYIREVKLSHDEWLATIQFLWSAGQISDDKRNEFALLSDVMGMTSLVDLLNAIPGATIGSVLGPFYADDSPQVSFGADLVKDNQGEAVLLSGTVRDVDGHPLLGAICDASRPATPKGVTPLRPYCLLLTRSRWTAPSVPCSRPQPAPLGGLHTIISSSAPRGTIRS
jgi:hydroxyquinol 1,2-dioxygenase